MTTILITGCSAGIGSVLAERLATRADLKLILTSRSPARGQAALARLQATCPQADIEFRTLDLFDLDSVRRFTANWGDTPLDMVVANAGVMWLPFQRSAEGVEQTLATNHLGHFVLLSGLMPHLERRQGRVVIVASEKARETDKLPDFSWEEVNNADTHGRNVAYVRSKLANLQFAHALRRQLKKRGSSVRIVACHPGVSADTELFSRFVPRPARWLLRKTVFQPDVKACSDALLAAMDDQGRVENDTELLYVGPTGFNQYRGPVGVVKAPRRAMDERMQVELWALSERWSGAPFFPGNATSGSMA